MRLPLLFLAAILLPSAVLGWLGWRALQEEEGLATRQRVAFYQSAATALARDSGTFMAGQAQAFQSAVDALLTSGNPEQTAAEFPRLLADTCPLARNGAVLSLSGDTLTPWPAAPAPATVVFFKQHTALLGGSPENLWAWQTAGTSVRFADQRRLVELAGRKGDAAGFSFDTKAQATRENAGKEREAAAEVAAAAPGSDFLKSDGSAYIDGLAKNEIRIVPETEALSRMAVPAQEKPAAAEFSPGNKPADPGRSMEIADKDEPSRQDGASATFARDTPTPQLTVSEPQPDASGGTAAAPAAVPPAPALRAFPPVPDSPAVDAMPPLAVRKMADGIPVPADDGGASAVRMRADKKDTSIREKAKTPATPAPDEAPTGVLFQATPENPPPPARNVHPVHLSPEAAARATPTALPPDYTPFPALVARQASGIVSRLTDGHMVTLLWHRPQARPDLVFLAELDPAALRDALRRALAPLLPDNEIALALLDESGAAVQLWTPDSAAGFTPVSWQEPFVAAEPGRALPLWEAVAFLIDPRSLQSVGQAARWRLALTVSTALLAAAACGWLLIREYRRNRLEARRKSDFVANVSHELRTPLTSIRMFSELLRSNPPPDKAGRYAGVIGEEASRLTRIIDDLLDFSRLETRRHPVHPVTADLAEIARQTALCCQPQFDEAGFTLELDLPDTPVMTTFDPDAVHRILTNLLSNAVKYGRPADPAQPARVTLTLTTSPDRCQLHVRDSGPGIPRGHERRIFRKFHRADDSLASGIAGSGLGLAIARELARAMGGRLAVAPAHPGACFTLTIPAGSETPA